MTRLLSFGCITEKRYLAQAMPGAVIRALVRRGHCVDILCPHGGHFESETGILRSEDGAQFDLNRYDVILSRNRNALGLAMLAYADAAGIRAINTHASTRQLRNKAKMGVALSQAGVPCAPTILADDIAALARLHDDRFPLILKATYGDNSQGLRLVRRPADLGDICWRDGLVLAQHYLPNDGFDLKLYVCGEDVFAVRKPSPFNGDPSAAPIEQALSVERTGGFSAALTRRIMTGGEVHNGELTFTANPDYDLIVDGQGLKGDFPTVCRAELTDEFTAMVMRKLFLLNCGQAVAAYLGHRFGCRTVHEAATHPRIAPVVRGAVAEAQAALKAEYPLRPRR